MRTIFSLLALLSLATMLGCGPSPKPVANGPSGPAAPTPPKVAGPGSLAPTPPVLPNPMTPPMPAAGQGPMPVPMPTVGPTPMADPPIDPAAKKADVGAGKKGHYEGNAAVNIVAVPIATRFRAEELIRFRIQIPQAMNVYKATDPNNKGPKTHAEYMEKIIKANNIELPQLRDNEEYLYDPATELLMVAPKKK